MFLDLVFAQPLVVFDIDAILLGDGQISLACHDARFHVESLLPVNHGPFLRQFLFQRCLLGCFGFLRPCGGRGCRSRLWRREFVDVVAYGVVPNEEGIHVGTERAEKDPLCSLFSLEIGPLIRLIKSWFSKQTYLFQTLKAHDRAARELPSLALALAFDFLVLDKQIQRPL